MGHNTNSGSAFNDMALAFPVMIRACLMATDRNVWDLGLTLTGHTITSGRHKPLCNKACGFALSDAEGAAERIPNMDSDEAYTRMKTSGITVWIWRPAVVCSSNNLAMQPFRADELRDI